MGLSSSSLSNGDSSLGNVKLVDLDDFRRKRTFPRCPDDEHLLVNFSDIDRSASLVVYISHSWYLRRLDDDDDLRGGRRGRRVKGFAADDISGYDGVPRADDEQDYKFRLCVEVIYNTAPFVGA